MKLLLTSSGFTNKSITDALLGLTDKPFKELKLVFVPTAANVESGGKEWLINDLYNCKKLGFAEIDIVDISALSQENWEPRLRAADILMFSGGVTVYLMNWIRKSGLDKLLPELLKTRIYVGVSAGSIVATPNLSIADSRTLYYEDLIEKNRDEKALGFVNFLFRPHLNSTDFPMVNHEVLAKLAKNTPETIYVLDDNSAIKVDGDKIEVISEGKWERFN